MKKNILNVICGVLFALLLGTVGWLMVRIGRLNMLPDKFYYPILVVLILAVLVIGVLMLPRLGAREGKAGRRVTACILAAVLIVLCLLGALAVKKVHETVEAVTDVPEASAVINIYVRRDDPAKSLTEAADYTFGWTDSYDEENTRNAIAAFEAELGQKLTVKRYDTVFEMIDALYSGKVDGLFLNSAYVSVLEGLEGYSDFAERTRILDQKTVFQVQQELEETEPEEVPETTEPKPQYEPGYEPFLVYLSGSDTRSSRLDTSRSDVNILVAVNPTSREILLVNTPRDYYVPNPASEKGTLDKLTHCGVYGIDKSVTALNNLYHVNIDYYAQINFSGFKTLIDAIGGVTVYSEEAFSGVGHHFQMGENYLDGDAALAFARTRYAFVSGDNQRGRNQMKVIDAAIRKVTSGTTLLTNYAGILDSLQGMFVTSMPMEKISFLVKAQLDDMRPWSIHSYAVSGVCDMQPIYSAPGFTASIMWPSERGVAQGTRLIEKVFAGDAITDVDVHFG